MRENNEYSNVNPSGVEFTSKDALRALGIRVITTDGIDDDLEAARLRGVDRTEQQPNHRRMTDINRQQVADMLAASEAKVDARLANFDTSVKTGFADVKTGFADLKTEMQKMRGDFEKQSHDSTKWIIGSVFGMLSLAVAVIGVMINLNKADKSATQPAVQPAPIIFTVPGVSAVPAAAPTPTVPAATTAAPSAAQAKPPK